MFPVSTAPVPNCVVVTDPATNKLPSTFPDNFAPSIVPSAMAAFVTDAEASFAGITALSASGVGPTAPLASCAGQTALFAIFAVVTAVSCNFPVVTLKSCNIAVVIVFDGIADPISAVTSSPNFANVIALAATSAVCTAPVASLPLLVVTVLSVDPVTAPVS